tara:strand:+ start:378 stop:683 length:306 start_codon:yes stop_codon:yes gene_type:complete
MTRSAADKLNQDVQALVTEVADNLKTAAQKTGKDANEALQRSSEALSRATERLVGEARKTSSAAGKQVIDEVRAHPVTTAALVASAAALLGVLVARLNAEK